MGDLFFNGQKILFNGQGLTYLGGAEDWPWTIWATATETGTSRFRRLKLLGYI